MRTINVDGRKLSYTLKPSEGSYGLIFYETEFFEGVKLVTKKKYLLFGPEITIEEPNKIFTISRNIENPELSKEECKKIIKKHLSIYDRKLEIQKGQLI